MSEVHDGRIPRAERHRFPSFSAAFWVPRGVPLGSQHELVRQCNLAQLCSPSRIKKSNDRFSYRLRTLPSSSITLQKRFVTFNQPRGASYPQWDCESTVHWHSTSNQMFTVSCFGRARPLFHCNSTSQREFFRARYPRTPTAWPSVN